MIRRETRPLKALIQAVIADRAMLEPFPQPEGIDHQGGSASLFLSLLLRGGVPTSRNAGRGPWCGNNLCIRRCRPDPEREGVESDIAMGHTTSGFWVAFVKTGDPNGGGRPNWPRYDPASRDVLNFTNTGLK